MSPREPTIIGMLVRSVVRGVVMAAVILVGIVALDTFGPPSCRHRIAWESDGPRITGPPAVEGATIRARLLPHGALFLNDRLVESRSRRVDWLDRLAAPFRESGARAAVDVDVRPSFDARQEALQQLLVDALSKRVGAQRIRLAPPSRSARRAVESWIVVEPAPEPSDATEDRAVLHVAISVDPKNRHRVTIRTPSGTPIDVDTADDAESDWEDGAEPKGMRRLADELHTELESLRKERPHVRIVCVIDSPTPYSAVRRVLEAVARAAVDVGPSRSLVLALSTPKSPPLEVSVSTSPH